MNKTAKQITPAADRIIRRCTFHPYLKGKGPVFTIMIWDTGRRSHLLDSEQPPNHLGTRSYLGYQLNILQDGKTRVLFTGEDFSPPPGCLANSDESLATLMSFLTLKPGDTDDDYFKDYTPEQLEYCEQWAEDLEGEVDTRLGEF